MHYLSIFGPKHTTGPSDVLQGSYPCAPSLRYLSVSLRTSPSCVTSAFPTKAPGAACALRYSSCLPLCSQGSAAPTSALPPPTSALHPPWCHPISALPIQDQCVSSAPPFPPVLASPLVPSPSPESCPMASPSLKATFVFPAQAPSVWYTPGAAEAPLPHRVLHLGSPELKTASWIWGLEVTCRSKLLSFPQQSNCTAQAQPSLPPCCS